MKICCVCKKKRERKKKRGRERERKPSRNAQLNYWKGIGRYINLTFNALRTRMCKRLSLLAINSYLSWCGKRKRRHLLSTFIFLFFYALFFPFRCFLCVRFWKTFVKHWIYERIKLCFVKQLSGIIYGRWPHCAQPPAISPLLTPTYPLTAPAKWCVSIYNCCQGLRLKGLFMKPTNGLALPGFWSMQSASSSPLPAPTP